MYISTGRFKSKPTLFSDFSSIYVTRCKLLAIFSCRDIILDELVNFCGACSQWKELALVMRKCLPFLIIDANSPIDCKLHKRCPRFEWIPFCTGHTQCKPYEGFNMYVAGEMWQNLKQFFWKECMITEQWKRFMLHNQTHQIVHSSAM